jgi:hypothetical protein
MPLILLTIHRLQADDMSLILDLREVLVQGHLLVERQPGLGERRFRAGRVRGWLLVGARSYRILELRDTGCAQSADHGTGSEKETIFPEVSAQGARARCAVRERRRAGAKTKKNLTVLVRNAWGQERVKKIDI